MKGRFITFEGGEGAGKSTQIALLQQALTARGVDVITTREPGGTPQAEKIRSLFVDGSAGSWTVQTDVLLVTAARAEHVAGLIRPALARGQTVLCDRYVHSTLAYQGHGSGMDMDMLLRLHQFATDDLWPDLVLWLDLPAELGLQRSKAREGQGAEQRFEGFDRDFHDRVRQGFATLARSDSRIRRIDADRAIADVARDIAACVLG